MSSCKCGSHRRAQKKMLRASCTTMTSRTSHVSRAAVHATFRKSSFTMFIVLSTLPARNSAKTSMACWTQDSDAEDSSCHAIAQSTRERTTCGLCDTKQLSRPLLLQLSSLTRCKIRTSHLLFFVVVHGDIVDLLEARGGFLMRSVSLEGQQASMETLTASIAGIG